jgi:putative transposase
MKPLRLIKKITEKVNEMSILYKDDFMLMFEDEAGFGRINKPKSCWCIKGIRPVVPCHRIREYVYAYGAVAPIDGELFSLVLPYSNTECFNLFINKLSNEYPDKHILLVADNASWHRAKNLEIPNNIEIFPLLPYTPELNPIEMLWDELREKNFKNELFKTLSAVIDRLCDGLVNLADNKEKIKSITGWDWILPAVLKDN